MEPGPEMMPSMPVHQHVHHHMYHYHPPAPRQIPSRMHHLHISFGPHMVRIVNEQDYFVVFKGQ